MTPEYALPQNIPASSTGNITGVKMVVAVVCMKYQKTKGFINKNIVVAYIPCETPISGERQMIAQGLI